MAADIDIESCVRRAFEDSVLTPQAMTAICEAIKRSDPEVAGDSDSVLLGLLYSGSYTVDLVEQAGADARWLRRLATESACTGLNVSADSVEAFLRSDVATCLLETRRPARAVIETSDLLRAALSIKPFIRDLNFPFHLRTDSSPQNEFGRELELGLAELLGYMSLLIDSRVSYRRRALTMDERSLLADELARGAAQEITDVEIRTAIDALEKWYTVRKIDIEPNSPLKYRADTRKRPLEEFSTERGAESNDRPI